MKLLEAWNVYHETYICKHKVLLAHDVKMLVDVGTVPRSGHNLFFSFLSHFLRANVDVPAQHPTHCQKVMDSLDGPPVIGIL
jgi:hypothetical protein